MRLPAIQNKEYQFYRSNRQYWLQCNTEEKLAFSQFIIQYSFPCQFHTHGKIYEISLQ